MRLRVLPQFGDNAPLGPADEAVPDPLGQMENLGRGEVVDRPLFVGGADGGASGAGDKLPKFGAAVMVLPREASVGFDEEDLGGDALGGGESSDREFWKEHGGKSDGLRFRNDEEGAPRSGEVALANRELVGCDEGLDLEDPVGPGSWG